MNFLLKKIDNQPGFYALESSSFKNRYFTISSPGTCHLMAAPEVVGFDSYQAMLPATAAGLRALEMLDGKRIEKADILTILRGGLNYPIEESCHKCGIRVPDISFLSCERIIKDGVITGLDVKYEKLHTSDNCTLIIGDIIASGQTLDLSLQHVIKRYRQNNHRIKRIIFFTIGGTKAISLMEKAYDLIREFSPEFQGFDCIFYEGAFTVYENNGISGVNTPDIDFKWTEGCITPEFRNYVLDYDYAPALLEKCIIYDGGARRYEIDDHKEEVLEYWERLLNACGKVDTFDMVAEKLGYKEITYPDWLKLNKYPSDANLLELYNKELQYTQELTEVELETLCKNRIAQLKNYFKQY